MRDPDVDVVEEVLSSKALWRIMDKLTEEKHSIENHRTAKLWLQYIEMIGILQMFIKAERTGDWALHLQTIQAMLPYFAAAGHNLYAKSAHMYLQTMPTFIPVSSTVSMSSGGVSAIGQDYLQT